MKILAVDTSAVVASCAIVDDEKLIGEITINNKLTHSQNLMPMIDRLLKDTECSLKDIDLFACAIGPGSYTGLRIGAATVKALANGLEKKVIGINTLEALAYNLPHCEHLITPLMDARKNRVFTATYLWEDGELREVSEPCVTTIEECVNDCGNFLDTVFTGDGSIIHKDFIKEKLGEHAFFVPASGSLQSAAAVASLAYLKRDEATDSAELVPMYIGRTQGDK